MKKHINNLVLILSIVCVVLITLNYQSIFPRADSNNVIATNTDALNETTTEVVEQCNTEDVANSAVATQQDATDITAQQTIIADNVITPLNSEPIALTENSYTISSQNDWDNLFNGTTDNTNWVYDGTNSNYVGDLPIIIDVNSNITSSNVITVPSDTAVTINFNSNNWSSSSFTINNGSLTINDVKSSELTITTLGCSKVTINNSNIDMTNTTNVVNTLSPTEVNFSDCTISQATNIVSDLASNKIKLEGCTITAVGTVAVTPSAGSLSIIGCNISTGVASINAIDLHSCTGATSISGSTFSNFEKAIFVGNDSPTSNPSDITITDSNFYNCKFGMDLQKGSASSIKISNCEFKLDNVVDGSAAIVNKYCFSFGDSNDRYVYKDITVTNYDIGIDTSYGSGMVVYDNCDISNCIQGIHAAYSYSFDINNCDIVGRDYTNTSSYGIRIGGTYDDEMIAGINLETYIGSLRSRVTNCTIDNVYKGIIPIQLSIYVYKTDITNCNSGVIIDSGGHVFVNECNITAANVVDENSFGVNTGSSGGEILNSTITGFNMGAYNLGAALPIYGCKFINNKTGMHLYCTVVYGSEIINSKIGFRGNSDSHVISCKFIGDNSGTGVLIDSAAIDISGISGSADKVYRQYNNYIQLRDAITLIEVPEKNEIYNFDIGIDGTNGYNFSVYDTYIHDCNTGIKMDYGTIYDRNEISNCTVGIDHTNTSSGLYFGNNANTPIEEKTNLIHDCKTGMMVSFTGGGGTGNYNVEVYNCTTGIMSYGFFNYTAKVHNCINGYIAKSGDRYGEYGSLYSYDNSEYNLLLEPESGTFMCNIIDNFKTQLGNDLGENVGNAYIDSQGTFAISYPFISGSAKYYLTKDSYVIYRVGDFEGIMTFDVPDYAEGRVVAEAVGDTYATNLVNKHKLYALEEGWVVTAGEYDSTNRTTDLYLTAGCKVTYDYATNGGVSMQPPKDLNGDYIVPARDIPYKKGESIDLSLIPVPQEGYQPVGWNTDPNATEGLTYLEAGTEDITLYAIYKKPVTFNYKTYSDKYDYSFPVWFYNLETSKEITINKYSIDTPEEYSFIGYSFNDVKYSEDENITVTLDGGDIYCLYQVNGELIYYDEWGNEIQTVTCVKEYNGAAVVDKEFSYVLDELPVRDGFKANCWMYGSEQLYPGNTLTTDEYSVSVMSDYMQILVNSLEVVPEEVTLKPGDDTLLIAKVLPENAYNKKVIWYSENTDIATVDAFGRVYAKADGVVKVWAKTTDGSDLSDYSLITVETPKERLVTVTGILTYPNGQAVADKTVTLKESISEDLPFVVIVPREYTTNTDTQGSYTINDVPVGDYVFTVKDSNRTLASCNIAVMDTEASGEDKIDVIETDDNASVDYKINNDTFIINVDVEEQTTESTTEQTTESTTEEITTESTTEITTEELTTESTTELTTESTTEQTTESTTETPKPTEPAPTTGDDANLAIVIWLLVISGACLVIIKFARD